MPRFNSKSIECQWFSGFLPWTECSHTETKHSQLVEALIFCKFKFSHIIVILEDQSFFLPHAEASGDLWNFWNSMHILVDLCMHFLRESPLVIPCSYGINDTRSVIATTLVHVFLALLLTLVSAHPAGSWTNPVWKEQTQCSLVPTFLQGVGSEDWEFIHDSVMLLPLTGQALRSGPGEQVV